MMIDPASASALVHPAYGDVCFVPPHPQALFHQSWAEASSSPLILDKFLEKQRLEVECSLQLQNERLRLGVQQQRNHQLAVLIHGLEAKASFLMRLKQDEMAHASKRTTVLQDYLRRAEMESQSWQRLAREKEAMIVELEKVKESLVHRPEDAQSCCGSSGRGEESTRMACKSCKERRSSVLFLPCRHLCSCKYCEAFLYSCPVCESVKEASMEVFLSC